MRELSISELDIVSGGNNASDCKTDVIAGAGLGATAGAAATAWAGAWAAIGAAVGAVVGGAVAASNSAACKAGNDYCKDGGNY